MSDYDALNAAILNAPDDDTPRLVFADWLDENGDPERAEFLRGQIHLAREPGPDPDCDVGKVGYLRKAVACPRCWTRLRLRLWDIESRRGAEWAAAAYPPGAVDSWRPTSMGFRLPGPFLEISTERGLPGRVRCALSELPAAAEILHRAPISEFRIGLTAGLWANVSIRRASAIGPRIWRAQITWQWAENGEPIHYRHMATTNSRRALANGLSAWVHGRLLQSTPVPAWTVG